MTTKPANPPASVPLLSLDAVAFDSETTGLDTSKARMIQLGAVRIQHGIVDETECFQQLINPGVAIPPENQAIHGISDQDVSDAPPFIEVCNAFDRWRGDSVLIGYATGFDLAILKREQALAQMPWRTPRWLDVRFMVNLVQPNLPDFSLDTIADWLDIKIEGRHTALGDAIATAAIFVALIPKLRHHDIRTLAEAERACESFCQNAPQQTPVGWLDINQAETRQHELARLDSFPYRHRLSELMSSPALIIEPQLTLREALALLIENKVSSLFVQPPQVGNKVGIVTERDLLRQLHQKGDAAFETPVHESAKYPLLSLSAEAFVYRAIARMQRKHIRHLGVHDEHGNIVGALSARDLLRQRADDAVLLGDDIDAAQNAAQMAAVWGNIVLVAKSLVDEEVDARDIAAVISRELCALTRQACILAEQEMSSAPPCRYSMLVLGSGGRGESLLAMDQDNAIVFAHGDRDGTEDRWFAQLGEKVADMLDAAGVPYCKGNIMASNPDWRMSVDDWQALLQTWIRRQTPDDILNCDIFFDARSVHGDINLADQVLHRAFELGASSSQFIKLMSINACKNSPPLGLFGRFKLTKGRMDLKMGGIMPLFSAARALAIKHQQRQRTTPDRFAAVCAEIDKMHSTFENLGEAHRIIFNCILTQQLLDLDAGITLSNRVAPNSLSASTRDQLSWALNQVPNVPNLLGVSLSSL
jgi:DNA polymerase-3 subunit epsilon/CBS domain-containing protein